MNVHILFDVHLLSVCTSRFTDFTCFLSETPDAKKKTKKQHPPKKKKTTQKNNNQKNQPTNKQNTTCLTKKCIYPVLAV